LDSSNKKIADLSATIDVDPHGLVGLREMVMATFVPDGSMLGNRLKLVKSGEF
jgi:hypothetical protein